MNNIVEISDGAGYARGFWVTDSDLPAADWTWNDRGNGPELVCPDAAGPFLSAAEAEHYVASMGTD